MDWTIDNYFGNLNVHRTVFGTRIGIPQGMCGGASCDSPGFDYSLPLEVKYFVVLQKEDIGVDWKVHSKSIWKGGWYLYPSYILRFVGYHVNALI